MVSPVAMQLLTAAILTVASQFLLGGLLFPSVAWLLGHARRRWRVAWSDAGRTLCRAAPYVVGLGAAAAVAQGFVVGRFPLLWSHAGWFVALGAGPIAGGYVMLDAGRREARGRLEAARRQVRLGGQLAFLGAFLQLVMLWTYLLARPPFRRALLVESGMAGVILVVGMICLLCAAFVALLAGLAGKPRPSAHFATLLYLLGLCGVLASTEMALGT